MGVGWAWYVNDLRKFLPAWQDMDLALPEGPAPIHQIEADVPLQSLDAAAPTAELQLEMLPYERPLAVTPGGAPENLPTWEKTHAMMALYNGPARADRPPKGNPLEASLRRAFPIGTTCWFGFDKT